MHFEFLLEEASAEKMLAGLLPRLLPENASWRFLVFRGKPDLLKHLPARLKGYRDWLPADHRIVVLVDQDREDCREIKARLEDAARQAGLLTKTKAGKQKHFSIVNRVAVEEIESWFLGDPNALRMAFSRLPSHFERQKKYRHPDSIAGGTAEALERLLQRAGYYLAGMPKTEVAGLVGRHLDPAANSSPSFNAFVRGVAALARA